MAWQKIWVLRSLDSGQKDRALLIREDMSYDWTNLIKATKFLTHKSASNAKESFSKINKEKGLYSEHLIMDLK